MVNISFGFHSGKKQHAQRSPGELWHGHDRVFCTFSCWFEMPTPASEPTGFSRKIARSLHIRFVHSSTVIWREIFLKNIPSSLARESEIWGVFCGLLSMLKGRPSCYFERKEWVTLLALVFKCSVFRSENVNWPNCSVDFPHFGTTLISEAIQLLCLQRLSRE